MVKAVRMHRVGGPEVLRLDTIAVPEPGPGQVLIRQTAIGVNYVDIYRRTGLYPLPSLPATLGVEAAGVVEAVGPGVAGLRVGQRVAYAGAVGGYAERRVVPAERLATRPPPP